MLCAGVYAWCAVAMRSRGEGWMVAAAASAAVIAAGYGIWKIVEAVK
jgi:hypothetical protein